jgi:hypothetical protein
MQTTKPETVERAKRSLSFAETERDKAYEDLIVFEERLSRLANNNPPHPKSILGRKLAAKELRLESARARVEFWSVTVRALEAYPENLYP